MNKPSPLSKFSRRRLMTPAQLSNRGEGQEKASRWKAAEPTSGTQTNEPIDTASMILAIWAK